MTMVSGIVVCLRSAGMIIIGADLKQWRDRVAPPRVPARGTPTIHGRDGWPLYDTTIEVEQ
jgi:hypothetical protein